MRCQLFTRDNQRGFTIVETMITLAIMGVMLVMTTVILINISNLYYKGGVESAAQDNARAVIDQVTQDLKFNPGPITTGQGTIPLDNLIVKSICIGTNIRYTFIVGYRIGSGQETSGISSYPFVPDVLWRDNDDDGLGNSDYATPISPTACTPINLAQISTLNDSSGIELIGANSRLTAFDISASLPYTVSVGVAFGSIDMFNNTAPQYIQQAANGPTVCNGGAGDQYCSTANLATTVIPRI
jgi:prepilin-type N-terminal cleavage/methylation domain-containing protein